MNKGQRSAILAKLSTELVSRGSWCGETHLQKATFLLQSFFAVETNFQFILYKHGPFSFDLRDALNEMTGDGLLQLVARYPGYGPSLLPTEEIPEFLERFPKTLARYAGQLEFVAEVIDSKGVGELERLATAIFLIQNEGGADEFLVDRMIALKPHIKPEDARSSFTEARRALSKAQQQWQTVQA